MSTKAAFKQKIEAELSLAKAKLAELKAQADSAAADARLKYAEQIDDLEKSVAATATKLDELASASEDTWERLKGGVEKSWESLSKTIQQATARFRE